jgi:uncharacterized membrane protein
MKKVYDFVKRHKIILLIAFLPYIALIVYFVICNGFPLSSSIEHWGQTGDFFGGMLNPIYSFFALIVLLLTFLDNKKQSEIEKFENNFFNMLDLLKDLLKDLKEETKENTPDSILSEFVKKGNDFFSDGDTVKILTVELTSDCRLALEMRETPLLDNIFRLLYQILKYIYDKHPGEKGDSNINERKNYSDIVRSFLPETLFWLLAINASIKYSPYFYNKNPEEYHKLIEEFAFLEDMRCEDFEIDGKIKPYYEILFNYDMKAFGDLKNVKYTMKFLCGENNGEDLFGSEKFKKLCDRVNEAVSTQHQEK